MPTRKKATRPCPCGRLGDARCRCTPDQVARYRGRVSGPLLDRIDLQIEVPSLTTEELQRAPPGEASDDVRMRVVVARDCMLARQGKPNAMMASREVERYCSLDANGAAILQRAIGALGLSARSYHRTLKVARSIADLAGIERIASAHVAEALVYRRRHE